VFALYDILDWWRPVIGVRLWGVSLVSLTVGFVVLTFWQVRKIFPAGGIGATTEQVIPVSNPFEHVCETAVVAVKECGWKLTETNLDAGQLKGKIGRSINTLYGQLFTIDVKKEGENSTKIDVTCSALYQLMDFGQNKKMITKFKNLLMNQLSDP
jgi:hypothetical protein